MRRENGSCSFSPATAALAVPAAATCAPARQLHDQSLSARVDVAGDRFVRALRARSRRDPDVRGGGQRGCRRSGLCLASRPEGYTQHLTDGRWCSFRFATKRLPFPAGRRRAPHHAARGDPARPDRSLAVSTLELRDTKLRWAHRLEKRLSSEPTRPASPASYGLIRKRPAPEPPRDVTAVSAVGRPDARSAPRR